MSRRRKIESELFGTNDRFDGTLTVKMAAGATEEGASATRSPPCSIATPRSGSSRRVKRSTGSAVLALQRADPEERARRRSLVEAVRRIAAQHADEVTFR